MLYCMCGMVLLSAARVGLGPSLAEIPGLVVALARARVPPSALHRLLLALLHIAGVREGLLHLGYALGKTRPPK
jgi:hypothetical protein